MDEMFQWEFCLAVGQQTLIEKEVANTQEEFLSPFTKVRADTTADQNPKDGLIWSRTGYACTDLYWVGDC